MSKHRIRLRRGDFSSQRIEKHKNYGQLLEQHQRSGKMGISNYLIGLIVLGSVVGLSYYALDRYESIESKLLEKGQHIEQPIKEVESLNHTDVPQTSPKPQGGLAAYNEYIASEIEFVGEPVEGIVYVAFNVEIDGSLSEIRVLKGLSPIYDQIAIDLIKNGPAWIAATKAKESVKAPMVIPVTFAQKMALDSIK